jgi:hypothetical protein
MEVVDQSRWRAQPIRAIAVRQQPQGRLTFCVPPFPRDCAAALRRSNRALILAPALLALGLCFFLAIRLYMGRAAEDRLDEIDVVDFAQLAPAPETDRFLMCPDAVCNLPANAQSPIFDLGWERLRERWTEIVSRQSHVKLLSGDGLLEKITYIQHTPLLRMPEIVTIQFIPLGEHRSSFAIESHSRYGLSGWGDNKVRVLAWVALLKRVAEGDRNS